MEYYWVICTPLSIGPIYAILRRVLSSQPGPRLDRKARARKDPKAHGAFKANQACNHTSTFRVLKITSQPVTTRRRTAFCPHEVEEVCKLDREKKSSLRLHARFKLAEALPIQHQCPSCNVQPALIWPHCHAMVPTSPACHWFEESCQNTAVATTQVHPAPCQSRPSKVKVVERQKQR